MARQRRSSGQPPEGSDPREPWRDYADDAGISDDDLEWTDDDADPLDGRPLPRRRRRGGRVARALAWIGGAALLMVVGGVLALATWPRPSGPAPTVAGTTGDVSAAPAGTAPRETAAARERDEEGGPRTPDTLARADEPQPTGAATPSPPPLPPLPPGLEPATPAAVSPPPASSPAAPPKEAAAPGPARRQPQPDAPADAPPPQAVRSAAPAPSPPHDTRTSAEIMADFLVSSGTRAQAEATARAYADWYAAGSAEHAYWLGVLGAIRARP